MSEKNVVPEKQYTPHEGPAPEPARRIAGMPVGREVQPDREPPRVESTPPPVQPERKAEELELRQQVGEMARTIGELKRQLEQQQAEFQLRLQAMRQQQVPVEQAPPVQQQQQQQDFDPTEPATMGQLLQVANFLQESLTQQVTAQAIRATWKVTPEMEQQILQKFPEVQRMGEPDRTRFILQAAESLGLTAAGSTRETLQAAVSEPANRQDAPGVQQTPGTVPLVETPTTETTEPRQSDRISELMEEYRQKLAEARRAGYSEQKEKWRQVEEVYKEILAEQGLDPGSIFDEEWTQGSV